jgi:hypothetical protein
VRKQEIDAAELRHLIVTLGMSQRQAARALGVSRSAVTRRCDEVGLILGTHDGSEELPPIPQSTGYEDRLKLQYILDQLAKGKRDADDRTRLRTRYLEILRSPNPDPKSVTALRPRSIEPPPT